VADHVVLIPGFFGFANLGDLAYFNHVADELQRAFEDAGVELRIHVVKTRPTASVAERAMRVVETMRGIADDGGPVHLVAHSSGGLDARLLLTPDVLLPTPPPQSLLERVRTVVTLATPHHGTPLASVFKTLMGQKLLALLSLSTMNVIRFGRVPINAFLKLAGLLARLDDFGPANSTLLDQLFGQLLDDFSPERRDKIEILLRDIGDDQSLIAELMPDAMHGFARATPDRPGVRYGCVVTRARPPGLGSTFSAGLDPSAHATHALYCAMYQLASVMPKERFPAFDPRHAQGLLDGYGSLPFSSDNDGVVPTLSQLHGDLIHAVRADHLDVIGHFADRSHVPEHYDWISTGTGFDYPSFQKLWASVAKYTLRT